MGPWDAKMRRGEFGPHDFPYIPGDEISGIVSAVNGDPGFAVGDAVFGSTAAMVGGYAEYALVGADHLAAAPDSSTSKRSARSPSVPPPRSKASMTICTSTMASPCSSPARRVV